MRIIYGVYLIWMTVKQLICGWDTRSFHLTMPVFQMRLIQLEQLERLRSENTPSTPPPHDYPYNRKLYVSVKNNTKNSKKVRITK